MSRQVRFKTNKALTFCYKAPNKFNLVIKRTCGYVGYYPNRSISLVVALFDVLKHIKIVNIGKTYYKYFLRVKRLISNFKHFFASCLHARTLNLKKYEP